jgi:HPt (histidine-containing phosphotransfer) domain-containing protein
MANIPSDQLKPFLAPSGKPAIEREVLELNLSAFEEEMEEYIGFLTETFLEDAPNLLTAMRQGVEASNATEVRFNVHTLKSSSATLGATYLAELCLLLESQSKVGDLSQADILQNAIEIEFERVKVNLLQIVNKQ